jgi:archaellum component FlaG (FlaF/FlaG flagellin family)
VTCDVPQARRGDLAIAQYITQLPAIIADLIVTATVTNNGSVDLVLKNIGTVLIPLDNQKFSIIISR